MTVAHHHSPIGPRAPAIVRYGFFILAVTMVLLAAVSSWTGLGRVAVEPEPAVETMSIRFADEADGGIGVYDPSTNDLIHVYAPEAGGFVRTALRALAFDRRKLGIGPEPAFELMRGESGQVTLYDPTTEKFVTLQAFGKGNAETFAQLFAMKPGGTS